MGKTSSNLPGEINSFFGLFLDNITNFVFITSVLVFQFGFPIEIILYKMIPGTAIGVMFGDIIYSLMGRKLQKEFPDRHVTAIPLGLDTPSTIGLTFAVIGPAFLQAKAGGLSIVDAGTHAWLVSVGVLFLIGVFKFAFSFFGKSIEKIFPQAALLGSLAGIGIAFLATLPLVDIFASSFAGITSFAIIIFCLLAKGKLPGNIPVVLTAVIVGTSLYYLGGALGLHEINLPAFNISNSIPVPSLSFFSVIQDSLRYAPVALPFALMTVISGINVVAAARVAGDNYKTRSILLIDACSSLTSSLFGGVCQTVPYIGHSAYKTMGGGSYYTIATGLVMGIGGCLGVMSFLAHALPATVLAPILVFVGIEIAEQALTHVPKAHVPAVILAILPALAEMLRVKILPVLLDVQRASAELLKISGDTALAFTSTLQTSGHFFKENYATISLLGQGYILTSMIWAGSLVHLINKSYGKASLLMLLGALLTSFGVMHSVAQDGGLYLAWKMPEVLAGPSPVMLGISYVICAGMFWGLGRRNV